MPICAKTVDPFTGRKNYRRVLKPSNALKHCRAASSFVLITSTLYKFGSLHGCLCESQKRLDRNPAITYDILLENFTKFIRYYCLRGGHTMLFENLDNRSQVHDLSRKGSKYHSKFDFSKTSTTYVH